jgi:hypothetical protein
MGTVYVKRAATAGRAMQHLLSIIIITIATTEQLQLLSAMELCRNRRLVGPTANLGNLSQDGLVIRGL